MKRKVLIFIFLLAIAIPAAVLFWIGGGFDKFLSPIDVVLPQGYKGIVCAKIQDDQQPVSPLQYEVSENGLMLVEYDVASSHRPWRFYLRVRTDDKMQMLGSSEWSPLFTENDATSGIAYTVFWVGTSDDWRRYATQHQGESYCLGRHQ